MPVIPGYTSHPNTSNRSQSVPATGPSDSGSDHVSIQLYKQIHINGLSNSVRLDLWTSVSTENGTSCGDRASASDAQQAKPETSLTNLKPIHRTHSLPSRPTEEVSPVAFESVEIFSKPERDECKARKKHLIIQPLYDSLLTSFQPVVKGLPVRQPKSHVSDGSYKGSPGLEPKLSMLVPSSSGTTEEVAYFVLNKPHTLIFFDAVPSCDDAACSMPVDQTMGADAVARDAPSVSEDHSISLIPLIPLVVPAQITQVIESHANFTSVIPVWLHFIENCPWSAPADQLMDSLEQSLSGSKQHSSEQQSLQGDRHNSPPRSDYSAVKNKQTLSSEPRRHFQGQPASHEQSVIGFCPVYGAELIVIIYPWHSSTSQQLSQTKPDFFPMGASSSYSEVPAPLFHFACSTPNQASSSTVEIVLYIPLPRLDYLIGLLDERGNLAQIPRSDAPSIGHSPIDHHVRVKSDDQEMRYPEVKIIHSRQQSNDSQTTQHSSVDQTAEMHGSLDLSQHTDNETETIFKSTTTTTTTSFSGGRWTTNPSHTSTRQPQAQASVNDPAAEFHIPLYGTWAWAIDPIDWCPHSVHKSSDPGESIDPLTVSDVSTVHTPGRPMIDQHVPPATEKAERLYSVGLIRIRPVRIAETRYNPVHIVVPVIYEPDSIIHVVCQPGGSRRPMRVLKSRIARPGQMQSSKLVTDQPEKNDPGKSAQSHVIPEQGYRFIPCGWDMRAVAPDAKRPSSHGAENVVPPDGLPAWLINTDGLGETRPLMIRLPGQAGIWYELEIRNTPGTEVGLYTFVLPQQQQQEPRQVIPTRHSSRSNRKRSCLPVLTCLKRRSNSSTR